jgi:hypothetical protein
MSDSETSNDSVKRNNTMKSFITTIPQHQKDPKIPKNGSMQEIDILHTLEDIGKIIESGEQICENIQNITLNCCTGSKCGSLFSKCFQFKSAVKTGDNEAKVGVI